MSRGEVWMLIGRIKDAEIDIGVSLVYRVFDSFLAADFLPEGVSEFKKFASPESIRERISAGSLILVAKYDGELAGIIELRSNYHIALLFTAVQFQRRGIAKRLLDTAIKLSKVRQPDIKRITVNSSPYAVEIYKRMGFVPITGEQFRYGLKYTPMVKVF